MTERCHRCGANAVDVMYDGWIGDIGFCKPCGEIDKRDDASRIVTEAWALRMGFVEIRQCTIGNVGLEYVGPSATVEIWFTYGDDDPHVRFVDDTGAGPWLSHMNTRGDVRLLCYAAQIALHHRDPTAFMEIG